MFNDDLIAVPRSTYVLHRKWLTQSVPVSYSLPSLRKSIALTSRKEEMSHIGDSGICKNNFCSMTTTRVII